jgi:hypothetical protein
VVVVVVALLSAILFNPVLLSALVVDLCVLFAQPLHRGAHKPLSKNSKTTPRKTQSRKTLGQRRQN